MSSKSLVKRTLLKLMLAKRTAAEKVSFARGVCNSMSGNPYFSGQAAIILELADATDQLADACAEALNNGIKEEYNLALCEGEWNRVMARVGFAVQSIADQDFILSASIILSAGMQVRNGRQKNPLPEPADVFARFSDAPGTAKLLIRGCKYAKTFSIYASEKLNDPESWIFVGHVIKRQYMVTGLKSATRYYFKACGTGTKGTGPTGNIATLCLQ